MHKTRSISIPAGLWLVIVFAVAGRMAIAAAPEVQPIRVGLTVSLTGELAAPGTEQLQGMQMWAEDLNARGELLGRPVELVYYDDKSAPDTSARLYEKLIARDKVDLLLGPYSSDLTLEASTVAEQHDFPMVATGAASTRIWSRGYDNIFGVDAPASTYMDLVMDSAHRVGLRRVALIYADTEFTREVAEGARTRARDLGMEIVFDELFPPGTTDFEPAVHGMRVASPDVVIGATYLDGSVAIMRAAKRDQLSPKAFVFTVGPALEEFGEALGPDAEGVMGVVSWLRSVRQPGAQDFSYRFKQKYGYDASQYAVYGYGAGQVLEAAVRLAGSLDKDAVRKQLGEMIFRSLLGRYRVDETGKQVAKYIYVMQWRDGRRRLVLPKDLREYPIEYPFKPWSER
ncbi:MAG: amino acid ABC transporter substrate-binding protein [Gammaproteobacteria bacterium]|jgi:branched-chain amino acid transport system substrate-binding protein